MPYKRVSNKVYHFKSHKWSIKQVCATPAKAEAAMRILKGLERKEKLVECQQTGQTRYSAATRKSGSQRKKSVRLNR